MDTFSLIVRVNTKDQEVELFPEQHDNALSELGLISRAKLYDTPEINAFEDEAIEDLISETFLLEFESAENKDAIFSFFEEKSSAYKYAVENYRVAFIEPIIKETSREKSKDDPLQFINNIPFSTNSEKRMLIAVLDSGVNYKHRYLASNLWRKKPGFPNSYGYNYTNANGENEHNVFDEEGHGTYVTGVLVSERFESVQKGIAGNAEVISMKIKPGKKGTYVKEICQAFIEAIRLNATVINNSWFIPDIDIPRHDHLEEVFEVMRKRKCIPVFAAGNSDIDIEKSYPQKLSNIIVVGSMNYDFSRVPSSNWGKKVTIWAPGEDIPTTDIDGEEGEIVKSGTSMAAPYVTGVITRMKQINPELNIDQIKTLLQTKKKYKIDKEPYFVSLLNVAEIMEKLTVNAKTQIMKEQTKTKTMKKPPKCGVPHDPKQLSDCIYTFLHLEVSDRYQLLYNYVDNKGKCRYQLYGRFEGERVTTSDGVSKFLMTQVDLKLVNMIDSAATKYAVEDYEVKEGTNKELLFTAIITTIVGTPPKKPETFKRPYLFEKNQSIRFNVGTRPVGVDRNGIPCNVFAFF